VGDPGNVTSNFGVNSPNESYSNVGYAQRRNQFLGTANVANTGALYHSTFGVAPMGSIGTCFGIESKGNKVQYYSPSFGGFTFGVSFAPSGSARFAGGGLAYGTDVTAPNGGAGNNILSVGFDYSHDFGSWNLTAGGGGEWAFTLYTPAGLSTGGSEKPAWYQGGLQVGFGHFAVGFSGAYYQNYAHAGYAATTAAPTSDGYVVTGGGSYTIDAWSFGVQGLFGHYNQGTGAVGSQLTSALGVPVSVASVDAEKFFGASLNAAYALGPGISLEGQVAWTQANYGSAQTVGGFSIPVPEIAGVDATTVHSWEFDLGTAINF
jgi:predicted porin